MNDVTVLMTVYNGMPYLPLAVESVLNQTLRDFDFVVVNDGSTDGTAAYLAGVNDPRLRVLHQENQGTAVAANHGLAHCKTEFVARLDSDDLALPSRLAEQRHFLLAHPQISLVGTQVLPLGDRIAGGSLRLPTDHEALVAALSAGRHAIVHSSVMFRTAMVQQVGGYWSLPAGEDYDLFLRLAEISKIANLDCVLTHFRVHQSSLNGSALRRVRFCIGYACELARRRRSGLPRIAVDEFQAQRAARPWWGRAIESVEIHARGQYRVALTEIYGGRRVRGAARMAWAALCSPRLTVERFARILSSH